MSGVAERVVAEARALVGVPFRLQGRDPAIGLDCVGLAGLVLARAGFPVVLPTGYGLRNGDAVRACAGLRAAGLRAVEAGLPGDLALVRPGAMQLHLMILVPGGYVHAHAGLRRVVEMPGDMGWDLAGFWRMGLTPSPRCRRSPSPSKLGEDLGGD